ncbi:HlyU family transcriptional regulator [Litchfieldella xinjiangensis]|uniref:HlyU family transcriptional regulator n=1 Tax=Litchfieldella xinjiangensis TaxID=1166948 RepID=UPI0005B94368|nr:HlyU family transcriptional regulator [Halomonas xinjiangensis]
MFKKLLSGLMGGGAKPAPEAEPVEYKGYLIVPDPQDTGGQYRVSGWIRKPVSNGEQAETLEHRFERSDMVPGREACETLTVSKAQRFIDDLGDDIFKR